jgi:hypothetical protein
MESVERGGSVDRAERGIALEGRKGKMGARKSCECRRFWKGRKEWNEFEVRRGRGSYAPPKQRLVRARAVCIIGLPQFLRANMPFN